MGSVQSPHIWQLRDGRLIVRVTSVQDIGYNPDVDWPCFYFVSPDSGQNWFYLLPGKEELRQLVMESGARLPDGTHIYFDRRKVKLDGPERERIRISLEAMRTGMKFKGVLAGELPEYLQWTPMYVRKPGEQEWTQRQSYLPPALRLPVIRVVDRENIAGNVTDELIRELFEKLEHGDPSVPNLAIKTRRGTHGMRSLSEKSSSPPNCRATGTS